MAKSASKPTGSESPFALKNEPDRFAERLDTTMSELKAVMTELRYFERELEQFETVVEQLKAGLLGYSN